MLLSRRSLFGRTSSSARVSKNRPASRSRLGVESLERRELLSATPLNWIAPSGSGPNAIVLQVSGGDLQVLDNGNLVADQAIASTSAVSLTAGSNTTNTFSITGTAAGVPTTITCQTLNDTVNVGLNGSVQGIRGALTITNPPSFTTIHVDDSADATSRTVAVGNGASGYGLIHGLAPADISFKYADTASVTVVTGTGGNTVNVLATVFTTNLIGHGRDTVNIGSNGSVQGIRGALTITNPPSYTTILVDDSVDATSRTVAVGNGASGYGLIHGLAPADIAFKYADTASVTVATGTQGSIVNVLATGVTTNLIGHGRDTVNIGSNGSVQGIQGSVNISNPPSFTSVCINDSADPSTRNATLGQATINGDSHWETLNGLAPAAINYYAFDVESVAMLLNGSTSLNVTNNGGVPTTVNGRPR
jgi:hypothetical protein